MGEHARTDATETWASPQQKDGGLDVVCYLPFRDCWSGRPLYFVQCASGANWKEKRHTPVLSLWEKLLDLATKPVRGIAIPFALLEDDFRKSVNFDLLSLMLDRHRLCGPSQTSGKKVWPSQGLKKDLNVWIKARLPVLLNQ